MNRRGGYAPGVLLLLLAMQAAPQSNPGIRVHMHGGAGYAADGLLYEPSGTPRHAALLLIPDARGITQRVTDAATTFVAAGYVVVALDLNRGLPPDRATRSDAEADHDLKAALAFVCAQAHLRSDSVGLVGWGSGSVAALRLAGGSETRAVAIDEVAPLQAYAQLAATRASILMSFAGIDRAHTLPPVKQIAARFHRLGRSVETKVYPDAERGFDDPEDSAHFDLADARDIRLRETRFFASQLGR